MRANRVVGLFGLILSVFYLISTLCLPEATVTDGIGPKAFPFIISVFGIIISIILIFEHLFVANVKDYKIGIERSHFLHIVAVLGMCLLYSLTFERLGFLLSSILFLFGIFFIFNKKRWLQNSILSISISVGFYLVFFQFLGISLPRGILSF